MLQNNFFSSFSIVVLHCCLGDNAKYGLSSKPLFQRKQEYVGRKDCQGNNRILLKIVCFTYETG